jgi:hypothetical protein
MSGLTILDLVIGMIFIYFLLSVICSAAVELWFSVLNTRANLLTKWLIKVFDKPALDSSGKPIPVLDKAGTPIYKKDSAGKPLRKKDINGNDIPVKDENGNTKRDIKGDIEYEYELITNSVGTEILNHCITTALSKTGKSTSYINAENFVTALLDKITIIPASSPSASTQLPPANLPEYIAAIQQSDLISGELKRTLLAFANEASLAAKAINTIPAAANVSNTITTTIKSDLEIFRNKLENWYDTNADRLTGALKRTKALPATIIIGVLLTIGLNVDSVSISKYFYSHPEVTSKFASKALDEYDRYKNEVDSLHKLNQLSDPSDSVTLRKLDKNLERVQTDLNRLTTALPEGLPFGWPNVPDSKPSEIWAIVKCHWLGWVATILALCMGSPFWFDLLNKVANLRGAGPKPTPSADADEKNVVK